MSVADRTATSPAAEALKPRLASVRPAADDDLAWLPAWRIRELVAARAVSPVEVARRFLARIEALDPEVHAFRALDAEGALAQAREAEAAVMAGAKLGAMHGVPVALKEFLPVKGLLGTDLFDQQKRTAERDSLEAERLRKAGAVIVGTTVAGLTAREFGASDRQPQNAWSRERVCGDSSTGSACAVAAALVPAAVAQDGLGSTRLPAAFCGLVGLIATRGRVPAADWSQFNPRLLSASGPLTRDVRDAALMLSVLAGPDGRDLMCLPDAPPDYLAGLDDGARGLRLAWTDDFGYAGAYAGPQAPQVIETVRQAALSLAAAGAEIAPADGRVEDPRWACGVIMASDRGLAVRSEPPKQDVARARETRGRIREALLAMLGDRDFILSPTVQFVAPTREAWAEAWRTPSYMAAYSAHTAFANLLGWPAISVPAGLVEGMPVGLQILGPPHSEPAMLRLAQAFLASRDRR